MMRFDVPPVRNAWARWSNLLREIWWYEFGIDLLMASSWSNSQLRLPAIHLRQQRALLDHEEGSDCGGIVDEADDPHARARRVQRARASARARARARARRRRAR